MATVFVKMLYNTDSADSSPCILSIASCNNASIVYSAIYLISYGLAHCHGMCYIWAGIVVKQRVIILVLTSTLWLLTTGCKTGCQGLFSSHQSVTTSLWTNWDQINLAFEQIQLNQTTLKQLHQMGFDPKATPNIKIMPYVDIVPIFMPNPNIHMNDLPIGVRVYVEAKKNSLAYYVEMEDVHEKRHGNILLDIFGFKRRTHQSGWRFKGIILLKDNVVVYTLSSGEPDISREDTSTKPLGPFQDMSDALMHAASSAY